MVNADVDWAKVQFKKSSYSGSDQGNCIEFGAAGDVVGFRDSKLSSSSPVLELTGTAFQAFLLKKNAGGFDQAG